MKKEKKTYLVIEKETYDFGDGTTQVYEREHYTSAVSEKQAINNIRHNLRMYSDLVVYPWCGDGARIIELKVRNI